MEEFLICPKCGQKEKFVQETYGTEYFTEKRFLNHNGEIEDYGDYEANESEITREDEPQCEVCEVDAEIFSSEKDLLDFMYEHTDIDGMWSENDLDVDQRDPEFWQREIAKKV